MGKYLDIDLSTGKILEIKNKISHNEKFIGGKGLGAKILFDSLPVGIDPLSSENILLIMTGPLSGTSVQTSGRWCVVTKSPHTGIFLDSQIGGKFGYKLKRAGFDFIKIQGQAKDPSILYVSSDHVDILSATDLWGKGTYETESTLKQRYPNSEVCSIGQAGENLVTYASIMTDKTHMAGRGGTGAVMGSKNLKAIVTEGTTQIEAYNPDTFRGLTRKFTQKVRKNPGVQRRHEIGTVMWVKMANDAGFLPTRNFQSGKFERADAISGELMRDKYVVGHTACYRCAIACGKTTRFNEGLYAGLEVDGPEYETTALLGSSCGIDDLGAIAKSNQICDDLGLDTITAGGTIAFAMEATKKGILKQTDVENLQFGNAEAQHRLLQLIATRTGVGELLSKGSFYAAQDLGKGSEDYAIQVKKLELAGVEPRGSFGMALAYATSDRGGCHQRCWTPSAELSGALPRFSFEGVPKFVKESQDERAVCFSLILCDFLPFDVPEMVEMLNCATGFNYSPESYLLTGERIWNLIRLFNIREGMTKEHDVLPNRFYNESAPEGDPKGQIINFMQFEKAKQKYYQIRGWDSEGKPTQKKLKSLGL